MKGPGLTLCGISNGEGCSDADSKFFCFFVDLSAAAGNLYGSILTHN